jgi:predicted nucleic acid-binding protein
MSGVFFDTSALVPVVTEQLVNHAAAHARFVAELKSGRPVCCSTHTLAECYAVLTALPLPQPISAMEAARLIETNFINKLQVVDLRKSDYQSALRLCADRGRISGQIYDCLHLVAAKKAGCDHLLTYNLRHFESLHPEGIQVSTP